MNMIEKGFVTYQINNIREHKTEIQLREVESAFYSGALAVLKLLVNEESAKTKLKKALIIYHCIKEITDKYPDDIKGPSVGPRE